MEELFIGLSSSPHRSGHGELSAIVMCSLWLLSGYFKGKKWSNEEVEDKQQLHLKHVWIHVMCVLL